MLLYHYTVFITQLFIYLVKRSRKLRFRHALYKINKLKPKRIICIAPFHRFFMSSKVLYNSKYHPSSGHSLCHSFVRRSHLLPDQLPGEHTCHMLPYHGYPIVAVILFRMHIFLHLPSLQGTNFTPWWGEAGMEFTSCPMMLCSQSTGSTEIGTHDVCIQSPTRYPFGHHVSTYMLDWEKVRFFLFSRKLNWDICEK